MRILAIGDFHGKFPAKLKRAIKKEKIDCIVVIGDLCDDSILGPLYRDFFIKKETQEGNRKILDFVKKAIGGQKKLDEAQEKSLEVGRNILEHLDSLEKPIFIVAGNWDQSYGKSRIKDREKTKYSQLKSFYDYYLGDNINPKLTSGLENVKDCMFRCHKFGGVNFIGYGLSSGPEDFEMGLKRKNIRELTGLQTKKLKKAEKKIESKLRNTYKTRDKKLPTFFISHNVPYGTKLDIIKKKGSIRDGEHTGSTISKNFCQKFKPFICVGGHFHENQGKSKIGKSLVVNTGAAKEGKCVIIDLNEKKGKVKKVKFLK